MKTILSIITATLLLRRFEYLPGPCGKILEIITPVKI